MVLIGVFYYIALNLIQFDDLVSTRWLLSYTNLEMVLKTTYSSIMGCMQVLLVR